MYGKDTFYAGKRYIVGLEVVHEYYKFIEICYKKLQCNITPSRKEIYGFIRVNSESVVPFCLKDGHKYVPLFYFEGETENLRHRVGIRNELFASDSCTTTSLDDIKKCLDQSPPPEEPSVASTILHSLTASGPVMPQKIWSWAKWQNEFLKEFHPTGYSMLLKTKFENCKQEDTKSIMSSVSDIENLCRQVYKNKGHPGFTEYINILNKQIMQVGKYSVDRGEELSTKINQLSNSTKKVKFKNNPNYRENSNDRNTYRSFRHNSRIREVRKDHYKYRNNSPYPNRSNYRYRELSVEYSNRYYKNNSYERPIKVGTDINHTVWIQIMTETIIEVEAISGLDIIIDFEKKRGDDTSRRGNYVDECRKREDKKQNSRKNY
ncbi:hypothetical protein AGLY_008964 [Aphis glycines]|uniref:Retrotransposon gag domain-containing protein n=1 Tax=Aphis glycines TaxID=307491 RepID=A0A6G0TKH1_APHGL|nr:hypothetical protein AGLY_008964 [Aphis glycines]